MCKAGIHTEAIGKNGGYMRFKTVDGHGVLFEKSAKNGVEALKLEGDSQSAFELAK